MEALNYAPQTWRMGSGAPVTDGESSQGEDCMKVLVCVNSEMCRRGICTMLEPIPEVCETRTCSDLDEAAALIQGGHFNVLMVSASPHIDVLGEIAAVAERNDVRIVVLLHSLDEDATSALGELPVDGFLLEEEVTENSLREVLASLQRGEMAMPGRLARRLLSRIRSLQRAEAERPFLLTPREQQALMLLADGMSNKQIARRLGISEHGAKRHVANVLAKLNCPNRTLAVAMALRYGLLCQDGQPGTSVGNGPPAVPPTTAPSLRGVSGGAGRPSAATRWPARP
jgi:DNA-binding NarL/FixJ family response regulator